MSNTIQRVCEYLRANDVHEDDLEGDLADELEELGELIATTLRESNFALAKSAEFAGLIADGDEEINEPWNMGGYGYEAHIKVMELVNILNSVEV